MIVALSEDVWLKNETFLNIFLLYEPANGKPAIGNWQSRKSLTIYSSQQMTTVKDD